MPNHSLKNIKRLIGVDAWAVGTNSCRTDIAELGITQKQAVAMVLLLTRSDFDAMRPGMTTDFGNIDADQYLLFVDESGKRCKKGAGTPYYIKLGVKVVPNGDFCVVVSFHEPDYL